MSRYDRAITVFSPDGHLFQVEYALEAVRKGTTAVGVRSPEAIVLAVEKKSTAKLQDPRTVRKVVMLDRHLVMTFAGLTADARVLTNRARVECQSYRLTVEDAPSAEYITKHVAQLQQRYTQSGGVRPFGLSTLIAGFDMDGTPRLFQTEPSGTYLEWKASAIGRNAKTVLEYLEKHYRAAGEADASTDSAALITTEEQCLQLAVRALLEVVEGSGKNVEIVVLRRSGEIVELSDEVVESVVSRVEREKKEAEEEKRRRQALASDGSMGV
ncbi:hypothetical protein CDCA_CDCA02G0611 [Cyanidium caldarium]|uniref:Proteasome subunit alpha type n=1 Tax=Cyanidium caldarium TaxID=2771 RepID=A0AAV9IR85_CYACA|nr:hypothetical protein CDCA_CDCA02G0611 [Cyanidium caldarium]